MKTDGQGKFEFRTIPRGSDALQLTVVDSIRTKNGYVRAIPRPSPDYVVDGPDCLIVPDSGVDGIEFRVKPVVEAVDTPESPTIENLSRMMPESIALQSGTSVVALALSASLLAAVIFYLLGRGFLQRK